MPQSPDSRLALRVVAMPRDTNQYGTIFGGVILSYIDQAGFVEARRHGCHRWVTAAINTVVFQAPVNVGDVIALYTTTTRMGTSSVSVKIEVVAERNMTGDSVDVTAADMTLVAVGPDGKPIPFRSPPTVVEPGVTIKG